MSSSRLLDWNEAVGAVLQGCQPSESPASFWASAPDSRGADSGKLAGLAFRLSSSVVEGKIGIYEVYESLERHGEALAQITRAQCAAGRGAAPPAQLQESPFRLEACSRALASLAAVAYACWQRAAAEERAGGSSAGSSSSSSRDSSGASNQGSRAAAAGPGPSPAPAPASAPAPAAQQVQEKLEWLLGIWGAACALASHSLTDALTMPSGRVPERYVDPVLRVATCTLAVLHAELTCLDATCAAAVVVGGGTASDEAPAFRFSGSGSVLAEVVELAGNTLMLVEVLVPDASLGTGAKRPGHLGAGGRARRTAAELKPFAAWRHATALLPFLEQGTRVLPHLRRLTEGSGRAVVSRDVRQDLEGVLGLLATCCTKLSFMLCFQKPRPGEGGTEVERRLASMAATGAKLARRLEAERYGGEMWAYLNTCMGRCVEWIANLRIYGCADSGPEAQEQVWRDMHQPDSKLAALVHVTADVWPMAQRHAAYLGHAFDENGALAAALLTNVAGLPMAQHGGLNVVAAQLQRCKDTIVLDWIFLVVTALRFAAEAQTELYCWMARDGASEALVATGAALARRVFSQAEQANRALAWEYIYSILLRTARKADELTGSHCAADLEGWLESKVEAPLRRRQQALGAAVYQQTSAAMHAESVMAELMSQPSFWQALQRTHLAAILAALRRAPAGGCTQPVAAEAAAARDRACAWLGCANPACLDISGPSEASLPVLRCARCRVAGYCGSRCQRADWPRHKLACRMLAEQGPA